MERETGEQGGVEFACQAVARVARKRSARHVLDYAEAGRAAIVDRPERASHRVRGLRGRDGHHEHGRRDRKSTRLNSSHLVISYAVFCLKKKKKYKDR